MKATLYRMVLPDEICPDGVQARQMLEQAGFEIDEHILATRMETDAFKEQHGIDSTPLVYIDGKKIGGCEELALYLEKTEEAA